MNRGRPRKTQRDIDVADMYKSGKTQWAIGVVYGLSASRVCQILSKQGITIGHKKTPISPRNLEIVGMYKSGKTLEEVGAVYGVTRERVRQIVKVLGLTRIDGGCAIQSFINTHDKIEKAKQARVASELRCLARWNITLDQYEAIVAQYGTTSNSKSPLACYVQQRSNANARGIEWEFTFASWWEVWQESGKWTQRGLGHGLYVMARHGDSGGYCPENVYICTQSQNSKDSFITSPAAVRFASKGTRLGRGKGFTYQPKQSKTNPYIVTCRRKYVGSFPTAELARQAYLLAAAA